MTICAQINAAALANALSPNTRPWVRLGTALGQLGSALLGQISNDTQVKLVTYGESLLLQLTVLAIVVKTLSGVSECVSRACMSTNVCVI